MILEFADEAKLYVPLTRLDLIQKYRSSETGPPPELNKLGTQAWQKTKARVKKAMADMSAELLRSSTPSNAKAAVGTAFSPDTNMQREFEDAFDFNETDDQITAIADIKADMESTAAHGPSPALRRRWIRQDRSGLCVLGVQGGAGWQAGRRPYPDHGPGFPALRVVQARRFADFPVNVVLFSRFRSAKEQK